MSGAQRARSSRSGQHYQWVGERPDAWHVAPIKAFFLIGTGPTILKEDLVEGGAWPVISASEGGKYFGYVDDPAVKLDPGDMVVTSRGTIGVTKLVYEPSTCTQTTVFLKRRPRSSLDSRFALYFMQGLREQIFPITQTAIPMLTGSQIGNAPMLAPPFNEQRAIADFLDRETAQIDAMIDAQERLVALLEERRDSVVKAAVTQGIDSEAEMRDSGIPWLGYIPKHWFSGALRHVAQFTTGSTPPTDVGEYFEGDNLWANISDIKGGLISGTTNRLSDKAVADRNMTPAKPGDLLFSFKLSVGAVAMVGTAMYTNEAIATFRETEALRNRYAYYALPIYVPENANVNIYGARLLNSSLIRSAPVAIPPVSEQNRIVEYLDSVTARTEAMITKAQESIGLMKERRAALISAAVTGRVDVRTGRERVEHELEEAMA